ncbi:hypothetical protein [Clostridium butyricum]|uniref:Uncharacterized protein n=1 Tax=Clostridium butyricum TaxID=1492 RepID=A0A2S7FF86_CLOBU|nr:hypothetical protein [Clostridium butyricum]KHD13992.1 hypothetical protein OA81_17855 [Clostridium butyricum]PPV17747.1 hypothetical protein AWN73_07015 [Clostridium butyricum]
MKEPQLKNKINTYLYLTGNCNDINSALEVLGIVRYEITNDIIYFGDILIEGSDENCIKAAVFRDSYEFNPSDCLNDMENTDFICLINFSKEKADEIKRVYGGKYIFNFADNVACKDFLIGFYYAAGTREFGEYLIYDIYVHAGYDVNKKMNNIIKSTDKFNNVGNVILPKLIFGFSKDIKIKEYIKNNIEKIVSEINYNDFILMQSDKIDNEFFTILY